MSTIRRRRTACGTCVRRKVKCDETHPVCFRCQKGKFKCEGYDPDFVFVSEDVAKKYAQQKSTSTAGAAREGRPKAAHVGPTSVKQTELDVIATIRANRSEPVTPLQTEIPYLSLTTAAHLYPEKDASTGQSKSGLASAFFNRVQANPEMKKTNSRRFGQTLKLLNEKLGDQSDESTLEVLKDAMPMLLYDLILFTSSEAWLKHVDALARVIQFRGPEAFVRPLTLDFLINARGLIVMQCLLTKRPCFLNEPEWQTKPWSLQKQPKNMVEQILDICCCIPGLLAKARNLSTEVPEAERPEKALLVETEIKEAMIRLFCWRWQWKIQNPWAAYSVPIKESKVTPSWTPFVSVIHFDTPTNARAIAVYSATFINLVSLAGLVTDGQFSIAETVTEARELFPNAPESSDADLLSLPSVDMTSEKAASEICALVDYCFEETHRSDMVFRIVYPLRVAEKILESNSKIVDWIGDVMSKITMEDAYGFSLATDYFGSGVSSSGRSNCSGTSDDD